jgi:hypothetical protein
MRLSPKLLLVLSFAALAAGAGAVLLAIFVLRTVV